MEINGHVIILQTLSGLKPSELTIIAGRPSMGKTALAMNIMENMANNGHQQAIISLEMGKESLALRTLSAKARIDSFKLRSGKVDDKDWSRIKAAQKKLSGMGLFINDAAGLTAYEIRSRARRLKSKFDIQAIWIDYLQLSHAEGRSREEETAAISREFKAMAKELQIPVVALSQLNRSCESRPDKRPLLSDLRDSGAIEQDGDVIMFIYRDEVYNKRPDNPLKGIADIIVRKNRNGPIGTVQLVWRAGFTRFENKI